MSLTSIKEMLKKAQNEKYAVGAFNVENMEMIQAVIGAAKELHSPVIIQTTPSTLKYATPELFFANVRTLADRCDIPIALHLDHGDSFELAVRAVRAGYSSVMIDGSKLSIQENIELTKSVVAVCHPCDISVEGELGCIGGKEDNMIGEVRYTDPKEAAYFASETKVDALAVAIGTAHGIYKDEPKLNLYRLTQIQEVTDVPLVLHGTSGVSDGVVKDCILKGICKVNYATDLRIAFSNAVKEFLRKDSEVFDPKKYISYARQKVKECVMQRICVCNSVNRA